MSKDGSTFGDDTLVEEGDPKERNVVLCGSDVTETKGNEANCIRRLLGNDNREKNPLSSRENLILTTGVQRNLREGKC